MYRECIRTSETDRRLDYRAVRYGPNDDGDPDRIRTCDPEIRNLVLYPAELRDRYAAIASNVIP